MAGGGPALVVVIPGAMKGKGRPRAAVRGKHVRMFTPSDTVNAEAHVRQCCIQQIGSPVLEGPIAIDVAIDVQVPASWSKTRRAAALSGTSRPTGKPDLDNCLKLVSDALNGIAWRDDAQIVWVRASKRYADKPRTVLKIARQSVPQSDVGGVT